jgi:hypothetical protein
MGYDAANAGTLTRPMQICNANQGGLRTIHERFNTACFINTASYTFGNAGRNDIRSPGRNQLNVSLQRNFLLRRLGDSNLKMRLEGFNLFNHPQFNGPGNIIGNSLNGVISSAGAPRQVQVAARITF